MTEGCRARSVIGTYQIACQLPRRHPGVCVDINGSAMSTRELLDFERNDNYEEEAMLRLVDQKKPTTSSPRFYAKVEGHRVPAVWRRTEVSTIHATVDGRVALCGDQTMLLPHSVHDGAL